MNWKNFSLWLKAGLVGFCIPWAIFILSILSFIFVENQKFTGDTGFFTLIILIPTYLIASMVLFGIGALICLIIQKSKSKK